MKIYNKPLTLSGTVMNTTITSQPQELTQMFGYSIQVVFTGTPTGTFKLQASSDPQGNLPGAAGPTHWSDITGSPYAVSAAGNYMWNVFDVMYNYVRLVYTDASGGASTAVITFAVLNGKGM
jgi:hypothetical protein